MKDLNMWYSIRKYSITNGDFQEKWLYPCDTWHVTEKNEAYFCKSKNIWSTPERRMKHFAWQQNMKQSPFRLYGQKIQIKYKVQALCFILLSEAKQCFIGKQRLTASFLQRRTHKCPVFTVFTVFLADCAAPSRNSKPRPVYRKNTARTPQRFWLQKKSLCRAWQGDNVNALIIQ